MVAAWIVALLISVALQVVGYLIAPRPKTETVDPGQIESPQAQAGIPIPVVFGSVIVKSPNVLWFGEKSERTYKVDA